MKVEVTTVGNIRETVFSDQTKPGPQFITLKRMSDGEERTFHYTWNPEVNEYCFPHDEAKKWATEGR
jgi:hypothetical protein